MIDDHLSVDEPDGDELAARVIDAVSHLEHGKHVPAALGGGVRDGNKEVAQHITGNIEETGMATTITALLFADDHLGLVHIGDSRAYLLRDGELTQLTRDDSRGVSGGEVDATLMLRDARVGDRYLLCTRGRPR